MRALSLTLLALAVAMATAGKVYKIYRDYDLNKADLLFEQFIKDYHRVYKDAADRELHFNAFKKNLAKINEENEYQPQATFDINQFADYTDEEMHRLYGFKPLKED